MLPFWDRVLGFLGLPTLDPRSCTPSQPWSQRPQCFFYEVKDLWDVLFTLLIGLQWGLMARIPERPWIPLFCSHFFFFSARFSFLLHTIATIHPACQNFYTHSYALHNPSAPLQKPWGLSRSQPFAKITQMKAKLFKLCQFTSASLLVLHWRCLTLTNTASF